MFVARQPKDLSTVHTCIASGTKSQNINDLIYHWYVIGACVFCCNCYHFNAICKHRDQPRHTGLIKPVVKSVRLACGRLGARIPPASRRLVNTGSDSTTAKRNRLCDCNGSSEIISRYPVSPYVWHAKEHSLLIDH